MHERPITKFRPGLEHLEEKKPLTASAPAASLETLKAGTQPIETHRANTAEAVDTSKNAALAARQNRLALLTNANVQANAAQANSASATSDTGHNAFLVYRITNPTRFNNHFSGPFGHVFVQTVQPVPGQVYNVLSITVRNGTNQTITASNGFQVKVSGQSTWYPILTGDQVWKPGQTYIFYILTKEYYPLKSQVSSGFVFNMGGAKSLTVPGPSAIFLRLTYNPQTIDQTLDWIVTKGPGTQGGTGLKFGLPVTSINEFVSAKTKRIDFAGHF